MNELVGVIIGLIEQDDCSSQSIQLTYFRDTLSSSSAKRLTEVIEALLETSVMERSEDNPILGEV